MLSPIEQQIKQKIERIGTPLKDWDIQINYGIKTGFNEAFIISGAKKDELIAADPKSAEIIRPILRGRDIKRYGYEFADLWLIATFPSRKYDIDLYPSVKEHLLTFGYDRLDQSGKSGARKKTNNKWFETQDSISYWEDFFKQKIVWNRIASIKEFSLVESGVFIADSMHFITGNGDNLQFISSIINSKIIQWLLVFIVGEAAGGNAGNSDNIKVLPIPKLSELEQKPFIELVDKILEAKKENSGTSDLEKQINTMVYKLYELTEEEIAMVENGK